MKDYSKYIPSSFGFITKLEIVGEEIHVWTPENKREPHKYPLSELPRYQKRLENQYNLIIQNKAVIKEELMNKVGNDVFLTIVALDAPLALAIAIMTIFESLMCLTLLAIPAAITILGSLLIKKVEKNFDEEMNIYELYLQERTKIETLSKNDKNITEHLSEKTNNRIKTNEELQQQGIIPEVFDIDLMDKTSLKQLQKLLTKYQISKSLQEKQVFVNPNTKAIEPKVRSRKITEE